jgi:hypothetical protein
MTLVGLPWIRFHVYDGVITVADGTLSNGQPVFANTKVIPDNYVLFSIENDTGPAGWLRCVEGGEIVKENDWSAPYEAYGFHNWISERANPAQFMLFALQNIALELNIPKALSIARVQ